MFVNLGNLFGNGGNGGNGGGGGGSFDLGPLLGVVTEIRDKVNGLTMPTVPSVDDITSAVGDALEGFRDTLIAAVTAGIQEGIKAMATDILGTLKNFMIEVLSQAPQPPELKPTDPKVAMQALAEAIKQTESTLNAESLVISNGTVELEIYVPVSPGSTEAGGRVKLNFTIGPRQ